MSWSAQSCRGGRRNWICRRLRAWLREIGLDSVDVILKSDNEPALTSMIVECDEGEENWSKDDHREQHIGKLEQ